MHYEIGAQYDGMWPKRVLRSYVLFNFNLSLRIFYMITTIDLTTHTTVLLTSATNVYSSTAGSSPQQTHFLLQFD